MGNCNIKNDSLPEGRLKFRNSTQTGHFGGSGKKKDFCPYHLNYLGTYESPFSLSSNKQFP